MTFPEEHGLQEGTLEAWLDYRHGIPGTRWVVGTCAKREVWILGKHISLPLKLCTQWRRTQLGKGQSRTLESMEIQGRNPFCLEKDLRWLPKTWLQLPVSRLRLNLVPLLRLPCLLTANSQPIKTMYCCNVHFAITHTGMNPRSPSLSTLSNSYR